MSSLPPAAEDLFLRPRSVLLERIVEWTIRSSAFVVIAALVLIFVFVGKEALPILTSSAVHEEVDLVRMVAPLESGGFSWQPVSTVPKYSLLPLFLGTLKVTLVALLFAIPVALGAAIFTSEFAPQGIREVLKPVVELLAGIPSVVVGFFALMVLATWLQDAFGLLLRLNAITAGLGLAVAVIPIVYTVAEDALTAVPQVFRDGSFALGANRWQTAWRVVLPAAMPGVFAACVLGAGRAFGETMIVLMSSGNAPTVSLDPTESFRSFSATIAAELGEAVHGGPHYHVLFFLGAFLFVVTFGLNLAGHWYVGRLRDKMQGKSRLASRGGGR
ncbi:MAG: phosphate ABC transporter permease subunit PstC [Planctomycetales bacterium]|nr:phosphate ABC transporter permease subunit PstC [Planctomycetales bacterium]